MKTSQLDRQADLIEAVLSAHKIKGRVFGGVVTPRFIRFDMQLSYEMRVQRVMALREEMAMHLGVPDVRVYRKGSTLRVEIPRSDMAYVRFETLYRRVGDLPELTAILGVDEEGVPLLMKITSPDVAHVLVAGTTGSGKTMLLKTIVLSLVLTNPQHRIRVALIDPKARGLVVFNGLPHLIHPVETDTERAVRLLEGLVVEMERRDRLHFHRPAILVVVDELADLRMVGGQRVERALIRLTQRGREAGIHVVVATQRPQATIIGGMVKANLPVRLVGVVNSPEDAKVATGMAGSGANRLRGRGDFLLVARQKTIRFQAAFVKDAMIRTLISKPSVLVKELAS